MKEELRFGPGPRAASDFFKDWSMYVDPPNTRDVLDAWDHWHALKVNSSARLRDGTLVKVVGKKNNGRVRIEFASGRREWRKARNVYPLDGHPLEELARGG